MPKNKKYKNPFVVMLDHSAKETLELNHQNFTFGATLGTIDKENKKVSFVLSNENVLNRGGYDLILKHGKKNVSFERKDILKVFYNHETWNGLPLGRWENLRLDGTALKADAVFDAEDEKAMEIFGKIERGFLESVSVGVDILTYTREQRENDKNLIIATKWEIYECSIVAIPANPAAQVGLAKESTEFVSGEHEPKVNFNKESKKMTLEQFREEHPELYTEVFGLGVASENSRVSEILTAVGATALSNEVVKEKLFDRKSDVIAVQASLYVAEQQKKEKMAKDIKSDGEALQELTKNVGGDVQDNNTKESRHEKMMKIKKGAR